MFISRDLFIDEIDSADSHHGPATVPEVLADDTPAPTATEDSRTYSNHDHPPQQVQPSSSTEEPLPTAIDPEHTEPQNDNTLSHQTQRLDLRLLSQRSKSLLTPQPCNALDDLNEYVASPSTSTTLQHISNSIIKIPLQKTLPKTSPSIKLAFTHNGVLLCKNKSTRSTTITLGLWSLSPLTRRQLLHAGYSKSNQALTTITTDSKHAWLQEDSSKQMEWISLKLSLL